MKKNGATQLTGEDYKEFMELFAVKKDGKTIGYNYNLSGYYFLLTQ